MANRRLKRRLVKREAVPQTPRESKIPGNKRVVSPWTGRTTWLLSGPIKEA